MNPKQNRRRGKSAQKKVAELTGGVNIGTLGGEDVYHENYSIEVKSVTRSPIFKWMEQAEKNNKRNKIPVVIVHRKGTQHEKSDLVIFKFSDVKDWFVVGKKNPNQLELNLKD